MECVKVEKSIRHANSPNCIVHEYPMQNREMNIGVAEIAHRYPDQGYALNRECSEMGYIVEGFGKLVTEKAEAPLAPGDVVYIPPGEKFYWEGNLTMVISATPAWHPEQHETGLPIPSPETLSRGVFLAQTS